MAKSRSLSLRRDGCKRKQVRNPYSGRCIKSSGRRARSLRAGRRYRTRSRSRSSRIAATVAAPRFQAMSSRSPAMSASPVQKSGWGSLSTSPVARAMTRPIQVVSPALYQSPRFVQKVSPPPKRRHSFSTVQASSISPARQLAVTQVMRGTQNQFVRPRQISPPKPNILFGQPPVPVKRTQPPTQPPRQGPQKPNIVFGPPPVPVKRTPPQRPAFPAPTSFHAIFGPQPQTVKPQPGVPVVMAQAALNQWAALRNVLGGLVSAAPPSLKPTYVSANEFLALLEEMRQSAKFEFTTNGALKPLEDMTHVSKDELIKIGLLRPGETFYLLGAGAFASTFAVCADNLPEIDKSCTHLIRVQRKISLVDVIRQSRIHYRLAKKDLAPALYHVWYDLTSHVAVFEMERVDATLEALVHRRPAIPGFSAGGVPTAECSTLNMKLKELVDALWNAGVTHGDFHQRNIGVSMPGWQDAPDPAAAFDIHKCKFRVFDFDFARDLILDKNVDLLALLGYTYEEALPGTGDEMGACIEAEWMPGVDPRTAMDQYMDLGEIYLDKNQQAEYALIMGQQFNGTPLPLQSIDQLVPFLIGDVTTQSRLIIDEMEAVPARSGRVFNRNLPRRNP